MISSSSSSSLSSSYSYTKIIKRPRWYKRISRKGLVVLALIILLFVSYKLLKSSHIKNKSSVNNPNYLGMGLHTTFKTHPFFYKKKMVLNHDDHSKITIVTQVSVERLERIAWMADKWRAPISAAVYIKNDNEIHNVTSLINNSYSVTQFVDIHLLFANKTRYPVNTLRNLSIKKASTKWVLLMDADFIPPLDLHDTIQTHVDRLELDSDHNQNDLVSFVVPSFASSLPRFQLPDDKESFIQSVKSQTIVPTNLNVCPKCHSPTNYTRWYNESIPYEVEYQWIYEPFLVFRTDQVEPFDERLKGYGFDKNSHTFGMAVQGFTFMVLPDSWIVHMNHPKQVWEGTDTYDEQMFDSLRIVCEILPHTKERYGFERNDQLFNEPIGNNPIIIYPYQYKNSKKNMPEHSN
ncbi:putative glycosyltransferase [Cavenderia fasciculata]|uniref:Glycosyltransferase n=1 Tax=Cavenderia fasciculata TaxID=261658 RepID=F4QCF7_CACFS|nr:putative glycosyltransferase [Cavenderia fasciculata]EGG13592.1 putative glycosyltransferase [Cavenderia fasciculata]|eukprot:XP_004350296.1 putative glycosyltransferase [Cavenderia fasciculata]